MLGKNEFLNEVEQYTLHWRRDGLPAYNISGTYDLFPEVPSGVEKIEHKWPDTWPNSSSAGVYAVFDEGMKLLYVGKSSMSSYLGARLGSYFGFTPERTCRVNHNWAVKPKYLITVAVPNASTWEAPALEEFLIKRLNPPLNRNGRTS